MKEGRVQSLERATEPDYPCQCSCAGAKADPLLISCWEAPLSPCSLHCHKWAGARKKPPDFCLELADTYHFASKRIKFWMLFPHAFWLAQLIFFLACNSASSRETTKTTSKPPKTNSTTAELCFCQGDSGSPQYEKQLLAPKVCPRNPSYILFPDFVTWHDAPGAVFLAHFCIK